MDNGVLFHRATAPWASPLDARRCEVTVRTPRGHVEAVIARHGDRYDRSHSTDTPLTCEGAHDDVAYWRGVVDVPTHRLRYAFRIDGEGSSIWLGANGPQAEEAAAVPFEVPYIHEADLFTAPSWLDTAIFYQVFPDRFRNGDPSNDPPGVSPWGTPPRRDTVCGGDIAGIRQSIGYLRDLGITALYSTPLFRSPSNHKYNTTDYETVDPAFGTNDDLVALSKDLHAAGIRLVLDGVFNHSGADWFAFEDLRAHGKASPYAGWFQDVHFPVDTEAVNYETFATRTRTMPKLNPDDPGLREYLLGVVGRWTGEAALDGWRLDVDNEVSLSFWRAFRERVRAVNPDAFLMVEAWSDALDFLRGDTFNSATNYPWRSAVLGLLTGRLGGTAFLEEMVRLRMRYPSAAADACVNLLGSHDTPRVRTVVGSSEHAVMGAVLLFTSPGVPLVYYGDEVGLEGEGDPDCRRCFPWDGPGARDPDIEAAYRRLIALRRENPWLRTCRWRARPETADTCDSVCAYTCEGRDGETLDVLLNLGGAPAGIALVDRWEDILTGERGSGPHSIPPEGAAILRPLP